MWLSCTDSSLLFIISVIRWLLLYKTLKYRILLAEDPSQSDVIIYRCYYLLLFLLLFARAILTVIR